MTAIMIIGNQVDYARIMHTLNLKVFDQIDWENVDAVEEGIQRNAGIDEFIIAVKSSIKENL